MPHERLPNCHPACAVEPLRAGIVGDTATSCGITVHSTSPVLALCRALIAAGHDPGLALGAYRGNVLALRVRTIGEAAALEVRPARNSGAPVFIRRGSARAGAPVRQNEAPRIPVPPRRPAAQGARAHAAPRHARENMEATMTVTIKQEKTMTTDERLRTVAAEMFYIETRRGWIAHSANPKITEQAYIERFIATNKDSDIDELEENADLVRPSNMPTAHEQKIYSDVFDALTRRLIETGADAARAWRMVRRWEWFSSNSVDDRGHETCRDWMDPEVVRLLDLSLHVRYGTPQSASCKCAACDELREEVARAMTDNTTTPPAPRLATGSCSPSTRPAGAQDAAAAAGRCARSQLRRW
jgi:hypothetical protein